MIFDVDMPRPNCALKVIINRNGRRKAGLLARTSQVPAAMLTPWLADAGCEEGDYCNRTLRCREDQFAGRDTRLVLLCFGVGRTDFRPCTDVCG